MAPYLDRCVRVTGNDRPPDFTVGHLSATRPDARLRLFCLPFAAAARRAIACGRPGCRPRSRSARSSCRAAKSGIASGVHRPYRSVARRGARADAVSRQAVRAVRSLARCAAVIRDGTGAASRRQSGTGWRCISPHTPRRTGRRAVCRFITVADAEFIAQLRRLQGTPEAVFESRELIEFLLPVLRADFQVCDTYVCAPEPPLACPLSAVRRHRGRRGRCGTSWRNGATDSSARSTCGCCPARIFSCNLIVSGCWPDRCAPDRVDNPMNHRSPSNRSSAGRTSTSAARAAERDRGLRS